MILATNPRIWIQDPFLNTAGITWKEFCANPEVMFQACLCYAEHKAYHLPFDQEISAPREHWTLNIVFGNVVEEAWFGAEIIYPEGQVSANVPPFGGGNKRAVFEAGLPEPFGGIMAKQHRFYEYFRERAASFELRGRPVRVADPIPLGIDGPLSLANGLRGTEIFENMLLAPAYFHELMSFITQAIIRRIRAWRGYLGAEARQARGALADDAIQFLSVKSYREHVLTYHCQILEALWGEGPHGMHLCGDVQRHLPVLARELNIGSFDTGFPIRFETLRGELGEAVEIQGGVRANDLLACRPEEITRLSRQILESGIRRGGRFIFKEANNLPPRVPLENLAAMYAAVKEYGRFDSLQPFNPNAGSAGGKPGTISMG